MLSKIDLLDPFPKLYFQALEKESITLFWIRFQNKL